MPGALVAVGENGTILKSTNNGNSWSVRQITTNWLSQVRYLNGVLVAVGDNGTILTSTNANSWTYTPSGFPWLNAVEYVDGVWFAAGNQGTVLGSQDLTNWASFDTLTRKSSTASPVRRATRGRGAEGAIMRSLLTPPSTTVDFIDFDFENGEELFYFQGQLDSNFFSRRARTW